MTTCKFCHNPSICHSYSKHWGILPPNIISGFSFSQSDSTVSHFYLTPLPFCSHFQSATNSCSFFLYSVSSIWRSLSIFTATIQIEDWMVQKGVGASQATGKNCNGSMCSLSQVDHSHGLLTTLPISNLSSSPHTTCSIILNTSNDLKSQV